MPAYEMKPLARPRDDANIGEVLLAPPKARHAPKLPQLPFRLHPAIPARMTDTALTTAIKAVARHEQLDALTLEAAFNAMLEGNAAPEEIGALLTGLAVRGETSSELIAGARAMREKSRRILTDGPLLDTCGTGGL